MATRMTKVQRAERDFWLGCAERAYNSMAGLDSVSFLCGQARGSGCPAYVDHLDLFNPQNDDIYAWWVCRCWEKSSLGHGPAEGRVLAACFLAAMAESGDI